MHNPSGNGLLAILGGSGLYELPGLADTAWVTVDTPWGAPSDQILTGTLATPDGPARLAFLPLGSEPPVGALTALLGGPLFLWLLRRTERSG